MAADDHEDRVRFVEVERDDTLALDLHLILRGEPHHTGHEGAGAFNLELPVECVFDVVGGQRIAVVANDAFPQLEAGRFAVGRKFPGFGEFALEIVTSGRGRVGGKVFAHRARNLWIGNHVESDQVVVEGSDRVDRPETQRILDIEAERRRRRRHDQRFRSGRGGKRPGRDGRQSGQRCGCRRPLNESASGRQDSAAISVKHMSLQCS
jgi:hypothetical protein